MTIDVGWVAPILASFIVVPLTVAGCWILRLSRLRNREQKRWARGNGS
jgi:hypothetical protein